MVATVHAHHDRNKSTDRSIKSVPPYLSANDDVVVSTRHYEFVSNRCSSGCVFDAHNDTSDSWFDNPDWSDLTIELSDARRIPVHKAVLCTRNEYFNAMFGLKSQFAVCQPSIV